MTTGPGGSGGLAPPMSGWTVRRALVVALLIAALISFSGIFDHCTWTPDEPRDAEIGREMLVSGDYIVPTMAGKPFLEKPPLYWWVMCGLYRAFHVSDGVARMTSAAAGLLALLLVFDLARRVSNPYAGVMSVVVTATTLGFYRHFHRIVVDPWLALFVLLGYWGYVLAAYEKDEEEEGSRPSPWGVFMVYLAAGLAFLTKGLIGPVLIGGPVLVMILFRRWWAFFRSWAHIPGVLLALALCLVWPLLLYQRGGRELLDGFLVQNLLYRVTAPTDGSYVGGHRAPFWDYLVASPPLLLPWIVAIPAVVHWLRRDRMPQEWNRPALLFLAWVFPVGLVLLSLPATKREMYLLPLIAPLGVVVGSWLTATVRKEYFHRIDHATQVVLLLLPPLAFLGGVGALELLERKPELLARHGLNALGRLSPSLNAALLILGLVILSLAFYGWHLWRRHSARVGTLTAWMFLVLYLVGGAVVFRVVDPTQNLHWMTADLRKIGAFTPALGAFRMDETTRCIVPYDTGVYLKHQDTPEALRQFVRENPSAKLLMLERNMGYVPEDIGRRLQLIRRWPYNNRRVYGLYRIGPAMPEDAGARQP